MRSSSNFYQKDSDTTWTAGLPLASDIKELSNHYHLNDDARHVCDEEDSKYEDHHLRQFLLRFPDALGQFCLGGPHLELHLFPDGANLHTGTSFQH